MAAPLASRKNYSFFSWVKENFYTRKMNSVPGWIFMAMIGIVVAFLTSRVGVKAPLIIMVGMIGILAVIVIFKYPEFGFYLSFFASAFISMPERMELFYAPMGLLIEMLSYLTLLAIIARQYRERTPLAAFWRNPISVMFLILIAFYTLTVLNPVPHSKLGWINFVRKQISYLAYYYMAFILLNSYASIRRFLKMWLILATIIALYGVKQQWLGLAEFENRWLALIPERYELFFQTGFMRKFSFLNDPVAFGVLCASTGVFTLVLAIRTTVPKHRKIFWALTAMFLMASSYSGTRTCNLMIVAALLAYIIFTINEPRTFRLVFATVFFAVFMLFGPFQNNPVVFRIKSTFEGTKDASASVRDVNRHYIQPYIHAHPIGGGLNTCSMEGEMYNPGHVLSGFPPDSGYMKILLEQGPIGLALHLIFYFIFLRRGITGFFESANPKIKAIYMALTISLFSLVIGQYSQLPLSQYPLTLYFFVSLVILYKLKDYDTPLTQTEENENQLPDDVSVSIADGNAGAGAKS